uniref:DUF962 domain-containing protein n=1 Tax=Chromera velia CCMP2878 TaxID=1169474 RepID=A0A0G4GGU0_9ALVE|eukprot:Cvel_21843.t1-p1 / transcript=Cvel_21843.t1 / gene=Cvel_21843 / organism=Chromera_velia_CCMP2878 / gene_product=Uncharacterized endoplasmic reticulum membrane, putative / transcript_product=Uncharacterized endoplasmic reticulum membrane, putative / location=Cvel_scaffold2086:6816-7214(+) / protein_length=133 / sequence_SO=supercontig / SO=protein_coding / is_pseudo=false
MTPTWGWPALLHILLPLYADLPGGAVTLAMYIGLLKGSAEMFKFLGSNEAWKWFLFIQLFSWVAQFYGHAVHEKRRPALMDNLLQIFAAPFFVTLEVLFALGYKPWLKKACEARVGAMLKELRALDAKKKQKN